jgi:hypothetical protein
MSVAARCISPVLSARIFMPRNLRLPAWPRRIFWMATADRRCAGVALWTSRRPRALRRPRFPRATA